MVNDLLDKAAELVNACEHELAFEFCARALSVEPDNVRALEAIGAAELELERFEDARKVGGR